MTLRKLSLCSGIGGDDLASEWAGIKTIAFVENNKYCQSVLRKHWPGIPIIEDVKDVSPQALSDVLSQRIDIISGGFPCQPHSIAGHRAGASDKRNLWPELRRILGEIKPRWFVGENVPGMFSSDNGMFFGGILSDLAALGYSVGWCCYGANDVGAWHKRDRVFIVAHARQLHGLPLEGHGIQRTECPCGEVGAGSEKENFAHAPDWAGGTVGQPRPLTEFERPSRREIELSFCGMAYGISRRVDRLKSLGNAVVPQQIYPVYRAIVEYESRPAGPEAR